LIEDVRYEVSLDLRQEGTFRSECVIRFRCREPEAGTHLDLTAPRAEEIVQNGRPVSVEAFDGDRVHLVGLGAQNEVRVLAECAYHGTEIGMHRFRDPVDGSVYLHTHLEPFAAHRVFACFDQPDIKGTFRFDVLVPAGWRVASNSPPDAPAHREQDGAERWTFARTPLIPTYITAVVAGPYHLVSDRHRAIDLGVWCRRSLAQYLDAGEILEITKQGLDFFEQAFAYPYPFGKYDQAFIPESNTGAMENAGCVTFNDAYIFRSRVTDAARERRAETILHEMAHMWFGDLVTMRWWNDLWLNESFASYMAVLCQSSVTRFRDAWSTFADTEKTWAYRQDQLPTTHPIVAEVPDVESIHLNFDGITYAKGASVLRQLVAWVGEDRFLKGMKRYTRMHEFANAELADFLSALEDVSGRDLHAWSKEWLEAAGVNTLRSESSSGSAEGVPRFSSFSIVQEAPAEWPTLRSHRVAVGLYDLESGKLRRRRRVELDVTGARAEVPELVGEPVPDLILLNDDDLTFAKIRLDGPSLATVVRDLEKLEDPLARTLCWTACWDMTRDGEMPAGDYVRLVAGNAGREAKVGVVQSLLAQAASAIFVYGTPAHREERNRRLAEAILEDLVAAAPGSDHQLAYARAFIAAAAGPDHRAMARGLLDGDVPFEGLEVDTDLRWHIVRSLASAGAAGTELIDAELQRDPSDRGTRQAAAAGAARPTPEAKAEAWSVIVEQDSQPLALVEEVMGGFQQFGQEEVLTPYVERFFDALPAVWSSRDLTEALAFGRRMFPHLIVEPSTIDRSDGYLASAPAQPPVRRLLLEGRDGIARALRTRAADGEP